MEEKPKKAKKSKKVEIVEDTEGSEDEEDAEEGFSVEESPAEEKIPTGSRGSSTEVGTEE